MWTGRPRPYDSESRITPRGGNRILKNRGSESLLQKKCKNRGSESRNQRYECHLGIPRLQKRRLGISTNREVPSLQRGIIPIRTIRNNEIRFSKMKESKMKKLHFSLHGVTLKKCSNPCSRLGLW